MKLSRRDLRDLLLAIVASVIALLFGSFLLARCKAAVECEEQHDGVLVNSSTRVGWDCVQKVPR